MTTMVALIGMACVLRPGSATAVTGAFSGKLVAGLSNNLLLDLKTEKGDSARVAFKSEEQFSASSMSSLLGKSISLRLGDHSLAPVRFVRADLQGADAVLGMDFLSKYAVGTDVLGTLTFWPGGKLNAAMAKDW